MTVQPLLERTAAQAQSRIDFWRQFIRDTNVQTMAEIGVYKGDFAADMLKSCPAIETYYLIDPWRHLEDWRKPANQKDKVFERFFSETMRKTEFAAEKRIVLRGKTAEVIDEIPDNDLDFAYLDGDHTLKGITIDLIRLYPKIRAGGWIGGDDFSPTIWQHRTDYEPTLVFPYAVYFAEAINGRIYALPFEQFLIEKQPEQRFSFVDLTGQYQDIGLKSQFNLNKLLKMKLGELPAMPKKLLKQIKNSVAK